MVFAILVDTLVLLSPPVQSHSELNTELTSLQPRAAVRS
jgi:hypothetical protein